MNDNGNDLKIGDKIIVKEGELNGVFGKVTNFEDSGEQVVFKPLNLDGYDDNLQVYKVYVIKYFEQGDSVRIINGKYRGETGTVMRVDDESRNTPLVMLDSSRREFNLNSHFLQLLTNKESEEVRRANAKNAATSDPFAQFTRAAESASFLVGDIVLFEDSKQFGYVIEVESHQLRVVTEHDRVCFVPLSKINKKIMLDKRKRMLMRDSMGNPLQLEDVVVVTNRNSKFSQQNGVIRNMHGNTLFLWDASLKHRSSYIFAE